MLGPRWPNVEPTGPTLGQSGANEVCCPGRPIHPHIDILTHLHLVPYMRRWSGSALVQVMAWRLFGTKPLPEPTLIVNWTFRDKYFSEIWVEIQKFSFMKMHLQMSFAKMAAILSGGDELIYAVQYQIYSYNCWCSNFRLWCYWCHSFHVLVVHK